MGLNISLSQLWPNGRNMVIPLEVEISLLFLHKQTHVYVHTSQGY